MIKIRIRIKRSDLIPLAESIEFTVGEFLDTIHYVDFYNLRYLVNQLRQKSISINTYDPFKPQPTKPLSIAVNVNVANTYTKIMKLDSLAWENAHSAELHRDTLAQIDQQVHNLNRIV